MLCSCTCCNAQTCTQYVYLHHHQRQFGKFSVVSLRKQKKNYRRKKKKKQTDHDRQQAAPVNHWRSVIIVIIRSPQLTAVFNVATLHVRALLALVTGQVTTEITLPVDVGNTVGSIRWNLPHHAWSLINPSPANFEPCKTVNALVETFTQNYTFCRQLAK